MNSLLLPACIKQINEAECSNGKQIKIHELTINLVVLIVVVIDSEAINDDESKHINIKIFDGTGIISASYKAEQNIIQYWMKMIKHYHTRLKIWGSVQISDDNNNNNEKFFIRINKMSLVKNNVCIYYHIKEVQYVTKKYEKSNKQNKNSLSDFKLNENDDLSNEILDVCKKNSKNGKSLTTEEIFAILTKNVKNKNSNFNAFKNLFLQLKETGYLYNTTDSNTWSSTLF